MSITPQPPASSTPTSTPASSDVIGIDLGTTYSCVGVWRNGHVTIIPNDLGFNTTPSCICFNETERLVGQLARDASVRNPTNTIYDTKRLIGRRYDDPYIQQDLAYWPFKVMCHEDQQILIDVMYKGQHQHFHPEEISAMILEKLRSYAEDYLGHKITRAVITVPAYFNDSQRQATADAAKIAGLECLRIINEPTAAALAYGLNQINEKEHNVLVYDLGGGTLDVSLLTIQNGTFQVRATSGDSHLGGEDFDQRIVSYLCDIFEQQTKLCVRDNTKVLRKLKVASEKAKITLSSTVRAIIEIDALHEGHDFSYVLTRSKLEELCLDLFKKCLVSIQQVIDDSHLDKDGVNEIVLVGGSTRIPFIQQQLREFFNGKELNKSIHPDEAVAYGAAIQGAILSHVDDSIVKEIVLVDVTPLSLGVETAGGIMSPIIMRNTPIPCTMKSLFTTYVDNQKAVTINIYEGERPMTKYNNKLGQFDLVDLPLCPRGTPRIEVTFDIDNNGILTVSANQQQNQNQIKIVKNKGRLSEQEILRLVTEAERFRLDDLRAKQQIELRNRLEMLIYQIKNQLSDLEIEKEITHDERAHLIDLSNTLRHWLDDTPTAEIDEYKKRITQLEQYRNIVLTRIYSGVR
jgi:heat shock 70kDa protein 1/2/6/8